MKRRGGGRRPKVLFVGHSTYDLPLPPQMAKKWDALSRTMEIRVLGRRGMIRARDPRFRLVRLGAPFAGGQFYLLLPLWVRREVAAFEPDAIIAQSPYEAAMVTSAWLPAAPPVPVIAEVHGDWRTASRYYGSNARRLIAGVADRVALRGLRAASGTRVVGPRMAELAHAATGRRPLASFPTWFDADRFFDRPPVPLPDRPGAVWVGVLERYKDPELLTSAWPLVVEQLPNAALVVVGRGRLAPVITRLEAHLPSNVRYIEELDPAGVSRQLDQAWTLVLSSRSEGLPRVGIEALARGRCIVGTAVDGVTDLVTDRVNGRVALDRDPRTLADALIAVLGDRATAQELGTAARHHAEQFRRTPDEYAEQVLDLVVASGRRGRSHRPLSL